MAYYKVIIDKRAYANQQLCQIVHRLGLTGIVRAVARNEFKQFNIFDHALFSIEPEHQEKYDMVADQTVVQDIDARVSRLVPADSNTSRIVTVANHRDLAIYKYAGFDFVKLIDIADPQKYRFQEHMATVYVCGYIYVAVDAKFNDEKSPIIVTIKQ